MLDWLKNRLAPGSRTDKARTEACAAHDAGHWERAVGLLRPIADQHPDDAGALYRLGDALYQLNRLDEALPVLERAAQIDSGVAEVHYTLANVLKDSGREDDALERYRRALQLEPAHARALNNSGTILEIRGATEEALCSYRQAIFADGALLQARSNLAVLLYRLERFEEASGVLQPLLQMQSLRASDSYTLGNACQSMRRHDEAVRWYERAIEADPQFSEARIRLHTAQLACGLHAEAIAGFRSMLKAEPHNARAACKLLLALVCAHATNEHLFEEHLAVAGRFSARARSGPALDRRERMGGKIRLGYVSADLSRHPIGVCIAPIIRFHDRDAFEVYLYSDTRQPDDMTEWFRQCSRWRPVAHLPDEAVAQQVRLDEIDILVVLAGRFEDNRLLLAAHRAAPVQVSMHDLATSGLKEMDYLIADHGMVPRNTAEKFTERVARVPTFYLHPPLDDAPRVLAPPAAASDRITFGSFNNPAKINERVIALWAQVLHSVPKSRLLLKYYDTFMIPSVRSRYLELFRRCGIAEERLTLVDQPDKSRERHLQRYAEMDVALDPFPFTGSTTTFEALWMGVPVVTLQGDRMVARWSAAMLRKLGLSQLIAHDEAEYVGIVCGLASNLDALGRLRAGLRERLARSPLCAGQARTRQLERLYRRMLAIQRARQRDDTHASARATRL